jgi:hypothetical protein
MTGAGTLAAMDEAPASHPNLEPIAFPLGGLGSFGSGEAWPYALGRSLHAQRRDV